MPSATNAERNKKRTEQRRELRKRLLDTAGTKALQTPPTIPPPQPSPTLILYARWTGQGNPTPKVYDGEKGRHDYKLAMRLTERVEVGRRVKVLAISPIAFTLPDVPLGEYDTYDPHVVGTIESIERMEESGAGKERTPPTMIIKIRNECRSNAVEGVDLRALEETLSEYGEVDEKERKSRKKRRRLEGGSACGMEVSEKYGCWIEERGKPDPPPAELLASIRPWPIWNTCSCEGQWCQLGKEKAWEPDE